MEQLACHLIDPLHPVFESPCPADLAVGGQGDGVYISAGEKATSILYIKHLF